MKFTSKLICVFLSFLGIGTANAKSEDFFFNDSRKPCVSIDDFLGQCYDASGTKNNVKGHQVRMRVIDPPEMKSAKFKFYLERPFFIIDGIHLSIDEERTLSQFQQEAEEFGIPEMLKSFGYTPVLVQFSQTVYRSLENNSKTLSNLLKFLNANTLIPFPNKTQDGFVILGISQGGILGRYGAYLYDTARTSYDAPVRLYASLDSPHQGAIMPRSLVATIDFWANEAEVPSAQAFNELITSPGARELLVYNTKAGNGTYEPVTGSSRFLFGDYRKAAEYKGFPAVLISQGQLKGESPAHGNKYFELERHASLAGRVMGRAVSEMSYSDSPSGVYVYNRMYEFNSSNPSRKVLGSTGFDFVQGSTYPFAKTMYESLREGMLDAMPNSMKQKYKVGGVTLLSLDIDTRWDEDKLYQGNSTFIPTTSAMDLKCEGDLSIRKNCAFTQTSVGFPFENPGSRSSAKAVYAVDPTHPRYKESISGRHIESPVKSDGSIDKIVLNGMQTDVWRVFCEVAKADFDEKANEFRNPKLKGYFSPKTNCMDQTKMPDLIKSGGILQTKEFAYARYDYAVSATEQNSLVQFNLPAGWKKVAVFDNALDVPASSIFEFEIKVENNKGNWMKAELLLTRGKNGGNQIQMSEVSVPQDGKFHTIRWKMPATAGALANYRWFRLVLNSNGGTVTIRKPKLIRSANSFEEVPPSISGANIYPNSAYHAVPWSDSVVVKNYADKLGSGLYIDFKSYMDGAYINMGSMKSMDAYKYLIVDYWPGTCQKTSIFFDAKSKGNITFSNGTLQNEFVRKKILLSDLINTDITPKASLSASRLSLQALQNGEKCLIHSIFLEK